MEITYPIVLNYIASSVRSPAKLDIPIAEIPISSSARLSKDNDVRTPAFLEDENSYPNLQSKYCK
jgi:hypothetical protein